MNKIVNESYITKNWPAVNIWILHILINRGILTIKNSIFCLQKNHKMLEI